MTNRDFDFGDEIQVSLRAPQPYRPGESGSIVSIRATENDAIIEGRWISSGKRLLLVEFADGSSIEIPDEFVEHAES